MENPNRIWIVTDDIPEKPIPNGQKVGVSQDGDGWGEDTAETVPNNAVPVDAEKLEQEMGRFLLVVDKVFTRAEQETQTKSDRKSGMQLDEIELSVEINGEGQVKLLGSGMKTFSA